MRGPRQRSLRSYCCPPGSAPDGAFPIAGPCTPVGSECTHRSDWLCPGLRAQPYGNRYRGEQKFGVRPDNVWCRCVEQSDGCTDGRAGQRCSLQASIDCRTDAVIGVQPLAGRAPRLSWEPAKVGGGIAEIDFSLREKCSCTGSCSDLPRNKPPFCDGQRRESE